MKIADIYKSKSLTTSFEVFPPNDKVGLGIMKIAEWLWS